MENKENVLILKKPIMIDGEETKEINYNITNLTGNHLEEIIKDLVKEGYIITVNYELDPVIEAKIFAEASNRAYMDIQRFYALDYSKATSLVRAYLFNDNQREEKENVIKLGKAINIEGVEITEVQYDFDKLSGNAIEKVFKEAMQDKYFVTSSYELDPIIAARMFAEAANIKYEHVKEFELYDYVKAAACARNFFMLGLGGDQEENN
ncbi:hypothetical protein [Clostridium sp. C2-6-12]|uniref:hypothetical protein n=1 Tax=Clostridium sp. C2-6-12 TaxID=2698832 RepID=UPI001FAD307E|nr:hypothetical protein [Clostridium sp. C2-6-12]